MAAETTQELGREGVFQVKKWLEATTDLTLPWNAYDSGPMCTRKRLDGGKKAYDLAGSFIADRRPAVVEAKRYTSPGNQPGEYIEFLANAYSTTAQEVKDVGDTRTEFIWVTTHPFSLTNWSKLTTRGTLEAAVKQHSDWLGDADLDQELLTKVAGRLWL